jgi:hypothetical protein
MKEIVQFSTKKKSTEMDSMVYDYISVLIALTRKREKAPSLGSV